MEEYALHRSDQDECMFLDSEYDMLKFYPVVRSYNTRC